MDTISKKEQDELLAAAKNARLLAYAPYSGFKVGASLLTGSGFIVSGANIENASYSLCICAERVTIASAIMQGHSEFNALAIAADQIAMPCGACCQVLSEFSEDLPIYLSDSKGSMQSTRLQLLFPKPFSLDAS